MSAPRSSFSHGRVVVCLLVACLFFPFVGPRSTRAQANPPAQSDDKTRGIELYKSGNNEGAVRALQVAVKQHQDDAEAWYYLGLTYNRKGDVKQARKAFERAIKLRPNFDGAQTGLAYSLLRANKFTEAEHAAKRALDLNAQNAEAYYVVGVAHLRQQRNDEALAASESALRVKPDFAAALLLKSQALLGIYEAETWEKFKAAHSSSAALAQSSNNESDPKIVPTRATHIREAAQSLERFLALNPNHPDAQFWREQLETLQVYTKSPDADAIFSSKEVTTRAVILSKPEPTFTQTARQNNTQGEVVLLVVLAADSKVKHILALKGLSDGLTEQSVAAARKIKFTPATKDGRRVSQFVVVSYNFQIY
ncbi:MAG: tetratricopeptide repeat protein [Pyrinomonadaceae bacterium]